MGQRDTDGQALEIGPRRSCGAANLQQPLKPNGAAPVAYSEKLGVAVIGAEGLEIPSGIVKRALQLSL